MGRLGHAFEPWRPLRTSGRGQKPPPPRHPVGGGGGRRPATHRSLWVAPTAWERPKPKQLRGGSHANEPLLPSVVCVAGGAGAQLLWSKEPMPAALSTRRRAARSTFR